MKAFCFSHRTERGFTLVEVTLALGIAIFCLVTIFGILNVGINTSSVSIEQSTATNILSAVANDLRAAPTPLPSGAAGDPSAIYRLVMPVNVPVGSSTPAPTGPTTQVLDVNGQVGTNGRYQLDVWTRAGVGRDATQARIRVSWPPGAAVKAGSVESFVAMDRN